jgi:hypothetical protein
MKLAWNVFVGFILINLLLAAGFVGWMYADGRVNKERIDRAIDVFSLRIGDEAAQEQQAEQLAEKAQKELEQQARLESTAKGPVTLRERLDRDRQTDEMALARIQLINDQNQALRDEMARFQENHNQRVAKLDEERATFEKWVQDHAEKTKDENFQQVVSLYEKQAPKQTKQAFQTLMQQGETEQVVEYLAAMSSRKAGAVLGQFKTPAEVNEAADLLERLRTRGEYTMEDGTSPAQDQS